MEETTRKGFVPCAGCGKPIRSKAGSLPAGVSTCRPCRKLGNGPAPAHGTAVRGMQGCDCELCAAAVEWSKRSRHKPDVPCTKCGKLLWRSASPAERRVCQPCRALRRPKRPTIEEHQCAGCGSTFERKPTKGQRPKWCSDACRNKRQYYVLTCERCSETFTGKPPQRFCSSKCYGYDRAGRPTSTDLVLWVAPKVKRAAPEQPHREPWTFVSGSCQRCGEQFTIAHQMENRYCSKRCARADGKDRRRALKRDAYVEDVYRKKVFERDRWVCQICRKRVARTKVVPHPKAPVLDHIIPLADGGTHEMKNAQCAHNICNSTKGVRGTDQLRLIG